MPAPTACLTIWRFCSRPLTGLNSPEIALVLLGDGKRKQTWSPGQPAKAAERHFPAAASQSQMPLALAAADACIAILKPVPMYATVYPNKVFDYMASGRPVILAIDGVIREVVEGSAAGIFVPPGDPQALAAAIHTMADHPEEARGMGLNGRKVVEERFDRPVLAARLARTIEQLVDKV
jgi:glycosyltransferase involved in cell wall biosynthesis